MGNYNDEGFIEIKKEKNTIYPMIILMLNNLEKKDLSKYTNIKLTIS